MNQNIQTRQKCIVIEDSHFRLFGTNQKTSKVITARNPFRKDDEVVDYDMDSEDEWAEENGEDLENKKDEEEDDEMEEEA